MPDWDNIVKSKKNVRSKDNTSIGNVIANYKDHILVIDDINNNTYKIPKSYIEKYDGSELYLSINHQDLKILNEDFHKFNEPKSINDVFMDVFVKGLSYMSGTIKIAIKNNDSLRIESEDKNIKLHLLDPSIFDIPLETVKDNKFDFLKYIKEAKEFAHKLSENELTLFILNKNDENAITLGKNANPSFSKLITRSDDIQINSVRKSIKLASDINKDEEEK
ncbi:MAG TPA: hypothetical protein VJU85_06795 [Nitrososphaeraceae archaeon]|nr:hypothetical protein [Nitrososphaeraceae archaeon]